MGLKLPFEIEDFSEVFDSVGLVVGKIVIKYTGVVYEWSFR